MAGRRARETRREGSDHGFAIEKRGCGEEGENESKKGMHVDTSPCRLVNNFRKLNYTGFSPLLIFTRDFSVA